MLVRLANREDPDQTASSSALFVLNFFGKQLLTSFRNFRTSRVVLLLN